MHPRIIMNCSDDDRIQEMEKRLALKRKSKTTDATSLHLPPARLSATISFHRLSYYIRLLQWIFVMLLL